MIDKMLADKLDLEAQDKDNARNWQMEADIESARRGGKPLEYFQIKHSPEAGEKPAEAFLEVLRNSDSTDDPYQIFHKARMAAKDANNGKHLYDYGIDEREEILQ